MMAMHRHANHDRQLRRRLKCLAACVIAVGLGPLLAGCTGSATMPSNAAGASPATASGPLDGDYSGFMTAVPGHDAGCRPTVQVTGMHVAGDHVSFGSFGGRIGLDNQIEMRSNFEWISGQFTGTKFTGTVTPQFTGCEYHMELDRAS
jgi:hypothetical protein